MLGSPILYLKGMRIWMFQLSGIYYRRPLTRTTTREPPGLCIANIATSAGPYEPIWVVVKIRVPFWVLNIIRHLLFGVPKMGP